MVALAIFRESPQLLSLPFLLSSFSKVSNGSRVSLTGVVFEGTLPENHHHQMGKGKGSEFRKREA